MAEDTTVIFKLKDGAHVEWERGAATAELYEEHPQRGRVVADAVVFADTPTFSAVRQRIEAVWGPIKHWHTPGDLPGTEADHGSE